MMNVKIIFGILLVVLVAGCTSDKNYNAYAGYNQPQGQQQQQYVGGGCGVLPQIDYAASPGNIQDSSAL